MISDTHLYIDIHTHAPNGSAKFSIVDASCIRPVPATGNGILYSAGIHPCNIPQERQKEIENIDILVSSEKIAAIGECGFDRTSNFSVEMQKHAFAELSSISHNKKIPMLIHCVHAADLLLQYSKLMPAAGSWIIHGFRGKPSTMHQFLDAGFSVSFGAKANSESVKACPADRLFLETDTATPTSLRESYDNYSALRGEDLESVIADNFKRIFGTSNAIGLKNIE